MTWNNTLNHCEDKGLRRLALPLFRILFMLMTGIFFFPKTSSAQQCSGSLGDPVFKETFGNAGTTVKPTLGGALPNGVTTYTYYSPETVTSTPVGPYPGQYTISNTTRGYNNTYFVDRPDHTTGDGTGYCMVVDAQATPGQFFERSISGLCAGTTFEFSAWIMNINPTSGQSQPSLRFDILDANNPNGTPIASISTGNVPYDAPGTWVRQAALFQMPSTTNTIILRIFSNTPSSSGNDLALDDIAFAACGPPFVFTQLDQNVCSGASTQMFVSLPAGSYSNYFFQLQNRPIGATNWDDVGDIVQAQGNNEYTFTVPAARGGFEYRVLAAGGLEEINNEKCRVSSEPVELKIIDYSIAISGTDALCSGDSTQLTAHILPVAGTGTPSTGFTFTWETSANGTTGWTVVAGETDSVLNTGALTTNRYYRVSAVVNSCPGDSPSRPVKITVNPPVTATLDTIPHICQATTAFVIPYTIQSGNPDQYSVTAVNVPGFTNVVNEDITVSPLNVPLPASLAAGTYTFNVVFRNSVAGCASEIYPVTLIVDAKPTTANAGPNQDLCGVVATALAGNVVQSGVGAWTQVNGPDTAVIVSPNNPASQVTGLIPGSYVFRWTIVNGACPGTSDDVTIKVTPSPDTADAGPDQEQYNSGVFTMAANQPGSGTGTWKVLMGNAQVTSPNNPTTAVTIASPSGASLEWAVASGNCAPSRDTVKLVYISQADIQITKSVRQKPPYEAGQQLDYLLEVVNAGPSDATNVRITDHLPTGFTATDSSIIASGGAVILTDNSTASDLNLTANIPASEGKISITITGVLNPSFQGDLTNAASAISPEVPDGNGADTSITIPVSRKPFLEVIKRAPSTATAGEVIKFLVTVENVGMGDAVNAVITDAVSATLNNVSWTATGTGKVVINAGASGTGNNISVTANLSGRDTGKVYITITGTVSAAARGTIVNSALATPSEPGALVVPSNTTHTLITSSPGLIIDKFHAGDDPVLTAGEPVEYFITILNNGPSDARQAVITDTLPAAISQVQWSTAAEGAAVITAGASGTGNIVRLTGDIPAGSSNRIIVRVRGKVDPGYEGTLINMATADPSELLVPSVTATDEAQVKKVVTITAAKSGPANAVAGERIAYTVDVKNAGPSNSVNTVIRDIISPLLTDVSWTATVATGNGLIKSGATGTGHVVEVVADINAAAAIRLIISGTIIPSGTALAGQDIEVKNDASVIPAEPGIPPVNSNEVVTLVTNKARLTISKSGPDSAKAGSVVTYVIRAGNEGPSNERGVRITDQVPATLQDVSWVATSTGNAAVTGGASGTGNHISVTGNIPAGAPHGIEIVVKGKINPAFEGVISNTAIVTPASAGSIGDTASKSTTVRRLPQPVIVKTAEASGQSGDSITYVVEVSNAGPSDAINLRVEDIVPAAVSGVTWMSAASGKATISNGATGTGSNVMVTGNIPAGAGNKWIITITGKTDPAAEGNLVNTAVAIPSEPVGSVSSGVTSPFRRVPAIAITKSGPKLVAAGQQVFYQLDVRNLSLSDARAILIEDIVPAALEHVAWTSLEIGKAVVTRGANGSGNTLSLTGDIPAGSGNHIVITIRGTVSPSFAGVFTNTATALPSEPGASRIISDPVVTAVVGKPAVRITKSGPAAISSGERINYTLYVTNLGPSTATDALITDTLPPLLRNVTWTAVASGGANISAGATGTGNVLRITGTIPVDSGKITIEVSGDVPAETPATSLANHASIDPAEPGIGTSQSDTVVTVVRKQPRLLINKIAPEDLHAGEPVTYTITVRNTGPSDAQGASITDAIPAQILQPSWKAVAKGNAVITAGAEGTGNQLNITANIPANEKDGIVILINGIVSPDFEGTVTNTAIADAAEPGIEPEQSQVSTNVTRRAEISVSKTGPAAAVSGDSIAYTIIVTNNGPSDANNITIRDAIPAGMTGASWTATAMNGATITSGNAGTGNVLITGNIPSRPQARIVVQVNGRIGEGFTGTSITNTVTAANDPAWAEPTGDTATVITAVSYSANLDIVKTGPANVAAGGTMQYIITVKNNGPSPAVGAQITDVLPAALQNAQWTATGTGNAANITPASGTGNVSLTADIPADGSTVQITVTANVLPAAANGQQIINTAAVAFPPGSITTDPNPADNSSAVITIVDNDPVLRITKTGPATGNRGDSIHYSFTVTNGGSGNLTNVQIEDIVPAGVTVSAWTAVATGAAVLTGAASGNTNTIQTTADIPVGNNSVRVDITGVINNNAGTSILNTARATAGITKESSVTTVITNNLDVSVSKTGPQHVQAGEAVFYVLRIKNDGPQNATDITFSDQVPPEITNVIWKAVATGAATVMNLPVVDSVGNNITLPATIEAGAANYITIYIFGRMNSQQQAGVITNSASATVAGITDYNLANNNSSVTTNVSNAAGLQVHKSGPQQAAAGNTVQYEVVVTNSGPSDAIGVNIADVVPATVQNVTWSAAVSGAAAVTGPFSGTGNNIQTTGDIPAGLGNNITISISGMLNPASTAAVTNVATASGPGLNTATDTVVTQVIRETGVQIRKSGPASITAGDSVHYNILVTNTGPADAENITVTDTLDNRISNVSWTATAFNGATVTSGAAGTGNLLSVTLNIPAGSNTAVLITIRGILAVDADGSIVNTATATPLDTLNPPVVTPPVVSPVEKHPLLEIVKNGPSRLAAGEQIGYTLQVTNNGLSNAYNALIQDAIPAAITSASWKADSLGGGAVIKSGGSGTGNKIEIRADIPAGGTIFISIIGTADAGFSGTVTNNAIVVPAEPGNAPDTGSVSTLIYARPVVRILKSGPAQVRAGETVTYRIAAANTGPSMAKNVLIQDAVPEALMQVSWQAAAVGAAVINGASSGTGNEIELRADLPPGLENRVMITVTGITAGDLRDTLRNLATATPSEPLAPADTSGTVETVVSGLPELSVEKTGPDVAIAGQPVSYTIVVNNNGISDALGLMINDTVPAAVTNVKWEAITEGRAVITGPASGAGNLVRLLADLPAGSGNSITIRVTGQLGNASGELVNVAHAIPSEPDAIPGVDTASTQITVSSQVSITKTGPAIMMRGNRATYVINVVNAGPSDALGAIITDQVPDVLENVSWTAVPQGSAIITGGATGTGNNVKVVADMPAADSSGVLIVINGVVRQDAAAGQVVNTAAISTPGGEPITSGPVESIVEGAADLRVRKSGTERVYTGGTITYRLTIQNNGPTNANGAVLTDVLPDGIQQPVVSVESTAGGTAGIQSSINGKTLTVQIATFPAGGEAVLLVTGTAGEPGVWYNSAVINTPAGLPDVDSTDNTSNTVVTQVLPKEQLKVVKTVSPTSGPYSIGQTLTYTLTVTNEGAYGVSPVIVADTLPPATVVSDPVYQQPSKGKATYLGNRRILAWGIGLLQPGETTVWSYQVTITGAGDARNIAVIAGPPGVSNPDSSISNIRTGVFADVSVAKQLNTQPPLKVNQVLDFTITATNHGPDTATNVVMTDQLAAMMGQPLSITTSKGQASYNAATATLSWQIPFMATATSETLQFTVKLVSREELNNTAVIAGNEIDLVMDNNRASITAVPVAGDQVFIPNIITPNGDGKNDRFVIVGLQRYPGSMLVIYNRWGNQVYQNKDYNNSWAADGLNESTYYYILKLKTPEGETIYKGWVEVMR
jgi:uncharacterized repeat protein (TIGR01451 family)/gliding motility-associated-like protein